MDMIGHQTVANQQNAAKSYTLPQQVEIELPICFAIKDEASSVPTLRLMVSNIDGDHSSETAHHKKL